MYIESSNLEAVRRDFRVGVAMAPKDLVAAAIALGAEAGKMLLSRSVPADNPDGVSWALLARGRGGVVIVRADSPDHDWTWSSSSPPPGRTFSAQWVPLRAIESVGLFVEEVGTHPYSAGDLIGYETWAIQVSSGEVIRMPLSDHQEATQFSEWFQRLQIDMS